MLIFFIVFALGLTFARLVPMLMKMVAGRYVAYGNSEGIAVNTYLSNLLLVFMVLYRRKDFFRTKYDNICFIFPRHIGHSAFVSDL